MPHVRFVSETGQADVHYGMDVPPRVGEFVQLPEFNSVVLEVASVVWDMKNDWPTVLVRLLPPDREIWIEGLDERIETHL